MSPLYPSILSADFSQLGSQLQALEDAGFSAIHCDIMDGHFVPNLTFGAPVLASLKTNLKMDIHFMVEEPEKFVDQYKNLPLDCITFHIEATKNAHRLAQYLKSFGCKVGVSLNPATHESTIEHLLPVVDLVLVMTVNPGFGGQSFIEAQLSKIEAISKMIKKSKRNIVLQVDGGITEKTLPLVKKAGTNCFVAGSYVFEAFKHDDFLERLVAKRKAFEV
jgi:ribulose-phosphate 3-epimerase